jgi:peptide/nickel transport system permease protein
MGGLIGGTVVVESIFAIPGIGSEIVYAIYSSQIFMLQSTVAAISVFYVAINFCADLVGTKIDPRTRERRA